MGEHVLKLHRYRPLGEAEGAVLNPAGETLSTFNVRDEEVSTTKEIYEKNKEWLKDDG